MAQRQESSVTISIEELLREAHAREEHERREAEQQARMAEQRRADAMRRRQEEEDVRRSAEQAERARRAFEEEKRLVELRALHEGTVTRARLEAETRARLAEITARQEHERSLHALRHDRQKQRLTRVLVALTAFAVIGAIGAGVALQRSKDDAAAADARLRGVREEKEKLETEQARLQRALESASEPGEIARLQQQLADAQIRSLTASTVKAPVHGASVHVPPSPASPPSPPKSPVGRASDACPRGDPLCATIP
jgi:DNA repair exonuclease SbcCD ATPase subunit